MASLTLKLKTAEPPERLTFDKQEVDYGKSGDGASSDNVEIARKSEKSKRQKLSKSQKLARLKKNLSKNGNSSNLDIKNNGPSFLTLKARATFNRLRLAFTKTPILKHFDLKCNI